MLDYMQSADLDGNPDLFEDSLFVSALVSLERTNTVESNAMSMQPSNLSGPELFTRSDTSPQVNINGGEKPSSGVQCSSSSKTGTETKRKRSSIACRACHDKRVRCDAAAQGLPCSNCRLRGAECVFIDSKRSRGGYGRFREPSDNESRDQADQYHPTTMHWGQTNNISGPQAPSPCFDVEFPGFDWDDLGTVQFVKESTRQIAINTNNRTIYVGEPSLFAWLDSDGTDSHRVHRTIDEIQLRHCNTATERLSFSSGGEASLSTNLELELLDSFWQNFYPVYPIVNKSDLLESWKSDIVSPLLKQSILYIGALHCPTSVLKNAGYSSKLDAIGEFWRKARGFHDSDTEVDLTSIVQSLFMLQFYYGRQTSHRDSLWWSSAAVNLAQTMGMHRSTKNTNMRPEDQRSWKKIWWLLYIRDRQIASGIGKPLMIDDRDCDVEEPTLADFVDGETPEMAQFTISLTRIARTITDVIRCKFTPTSSPGEKTTVQVHLELQGWHAGLDPSMQYNSESNRNRFGLLLSLVYHQMILLLHRPSVNGAKESPKQRDFSTQLAFHAADKISDLAGDILQYFSVNEFPVFAELIILSAMAFHSVTNPPSEHEEKSRARKRTENYISSLLKFDRIFFATQTYKVIFAEKKGFWEKLTESRDGT